MINKQTPCFMLYQTCILELQTSMARTPFGPSKLVRDRGSSSQLGLIIAPGLVA